MRHTYTIRTDAIMREIEAESADEAAKIFAAGEFPGTEDVADLFSAIEEIDGAWCWIESDTAPDGHRRSVGSY
jgi:hypothetical protein